MEKLYSTNAYPPEIVGKIETMGAAAVSIANRWMMGWQDRVSALIKDGSYIGCLECQLEQEKQILANETDLRHLSRREILEMYEIKESPPVPTLVELA